MGRTWRSPPAAGTNLSTAASGTDRPAPRCSGRTNPATRAAYAATPCGRRRRHSTPTTIPPTQPATADWRTERGPARTAASAATSLTERDEHEHDRSHQQRGRSERRGRGPEISRGQGSRDAGLALSPSGAAVSYYIPEEVRPTWYSPASLAGRHSMRRTPERSTAPSGVGSVFSAAARFLSCLWAVEPATSRSASVVRWPPRRTRL